MTVEEKAQKWDKLYETISNLMFDENGEEREDDDTDLCTLGEIALIQLNLM